MFLNFTFIFIRLITTISISLLRYLAEDSALGSCSKDIKQKLLVVCRLEVVHDANVGFVRLLVCSDASAIT